MKKYIVAAMSALFVFSVFAQTQKNMVIIGKDGSRTKINRENIQEITFAEAPEYETSNVLLAAVYSTSNGMASYRIDFANAPANAEGDPAGVGDFQIALTFTGELSDDASNAAIPGGYYRAGNGSQILTFNIQSSGMWIRVDDENVSYNLITGGTVDVRRTGGSYDIRCELETLNGSINTRYQGNIEFEKGSSEYDEFDTPQQIAFEGGQGRYYGNWYNPFADDASLQFYTGEFDAQGTQVEGYWLNVEIYMPKSANPMKENKVVDGIYNIEQRERVPDYTYLPHTFIRGSSLDMWGTVYPQGTYLTYIDKSGTSKSAHIAAGTITVSENGTKFAFDLVTDKGISVKGTCTGMNLRNFCDNETKEPPRPYSTLTSDIAFDFPKDAVCNAWNYGDYIVDGINVFYLQMADPALKVGDYVALELLVEGNEIADGTYNVSNSLKSMTSLIGRASSVGQPMFSWYGDLDSTDEEGYQTVMAPINGGTITVSTSGNGEKTFMFDLTDDNGHKMTGSWTGAISYQSLPAASVMKARDINFGKNAERQQLPHRLMK